MNSLKLLIRYPAAVAGVLIILFLIILSIITVITIPYSEAIRLWRGDTETWQESPRTAWPEWINILPWENRSTTQVLSSEETGTKDVRDLGEGISEIEIELPFQFNYDGFPAELTLFFQSVYGERPPHIELTWINPKGQELKIGTTEGRGAHRLSIDDDLTRKLDGKPAHKGLFLDPDTDRPLKGEYKLKINGWMFAEDDNLDARLVVYGQVHGLAGTDHLRRDLSIGLFWGIPVALAFGFLP